MNEKTFGTTTIAPEVVNTIARLTTLATPGVSRMDSPSGSLPAGSPRQETEGVHIRIKDDQIFADLYIVIKGNENVRLVAEAVQKRVSRAISEMIGMEIAQLDIHVTNIDIDA